MDYHMPSIFILPTTTLRFAKWLLYVTVLVLTWGGCASAQSLEQETAARLEQIRNIKADQGDEAIKVFNQQMDQTWQFFSANKPQVLPLLRQELEREISRVQPNDLLLLDVGYFVFQNDTAQGKSLALNALLHLNPGAPVIIANDKELFEFTYAAAREGDPRILDFIDSVFLAKDHAIFIPQHALKLDSTLLCVFLYGVLGPVSEDHLREKLKDKRVASRALETLVWLGSPASAPAVQQALSADPRYQTFARVTAFMMQSAGPDGRNFILNTPSEPLDSQSKQYLGKILPAVRSTSYASMHASFSKMGGDQKLADSEVRARLTAMIQNYGKDDKTSPLAILDSHLDRAFLIEQLVQVRRSTLYRLSDEALSDVEMTNALINTLRYKPK